MNDSENNSKNAAKSSTKNNSENESIKKELSYQEYVMREEYSYHVAYNPEIEVYNAVKDGNWDFIRKQFDMSFTAKTSDPGFGRLSENELQSIKYHFVIGAAIIARYCIEGGMEHEILTGKNRRHAGSRGNCFRRSPVRRFGAPSQRRLGRRVRQ